MIVRQILLVRTLVNVQRTVWRIWLLIQGCKVLKAFSFLMAIITQFHNYCTTETCWLKHLHWFAFFLLHLFSFISFCVHWDIFQCFLWGLLTQMASYNQEFCSRLVADGFTFSFGQHESVGRSLTFRVSAYSWDWLIGEGIWYFSLGSLAKRTMTS